MRRFLINGIFFACWLLSVAAWAGPRILETGFVEDPQGLLSLAQAQQQAVQPFDLPLRKGYTRSVFWVRVLLGSDGRADPAVDEWVLRFGPGFLDDIQVYDPGRAGLPPFLLGTSHGLAVNDFSPMNFDVRLRASPQPRTLWIRLATRSQKLLFIEAATLPETLKEDQNIDLFKGIGVGLLLVNVLFAFWIWVARRNKVIAGLVINNLVGLVFGLSFWGYFRVWCSAEWGEQLVSSLNYFLMVTIVPVNILFNVGLFLGQRPQSIYIKILLLLCLFYPVQLVLFAVGQVTLAMNINALPIVLAPILYLLQILSVPHNKDTPDQALELDKKTSLVLYGILFLIAWSINLALIGVLPARLAGLPIQPFYFCINGFILILSVEHRSRVLMQREALARTEAQQERALRNTQQRFVMMLAHEVSTPLSVLSYASSWLPADKNIQSKAKASIKDISNLVSRVVLMLKVENKSTVLHPVVMPVAELLDWVQQEFAQDLQGQRLLDLANEGGLESSALEVDPWALGKVLRNLLENAAKYGQAGSPVWVQAQMTEGDAQKGLRIDVKNQVPPGGFPDEKELFNKYYRGAHARHVSGTGLGLYICRHLMADMSGALNYRVEQDWVVFSVWLPCHKLH